MQAVIRIFYFLACALLGYLMVAMVPLAAIHFGLSPNVVTNEDTSLAQHWIFGGGFVAYATGLLLAISFFMIRSSLRYWFLFAPVYTTLIYSTAIIARLDSVYGITGATQH